MDIGAGRVNVASERARALHLATAAGAGSRKAIIDLERAIARLSLEVWRGALELAPAAEATPALRDGLGQVAGGKQLWGWISPAGPGQD
jgi:hypothetical protein